MDVEPPVTAGGEKVNPVNPSEGSTVTLPVAAIDPVAAVTVTGVEPATAAAVTVKVCELMFAGTIRVAGTGNAAGLLLVRLTMNPPEGALPLSPTQPVVVNPETTLAGLKDSIVTTGGATVRTADEVVPLGSFAVKLTDVLADTGNEETLNVPLVAAPAMVKLRNGGGARIAAGQSDAQTGGRRGTVENHRCDRTAAARERPGNERERCEYGWIDR